MHQMLHLVSLLICEYGSFTVGLENIEVLRLVLYWLSACLCRLQSPSPPVQSVTQRARPVMFPASQDVKTEFRAEYIVRIHTWPYKSHSIRDGAERAKIGAESQLGAIYLCELCAPMQLQIQWSFRLPCTWPAEGLCCSRGMYSHSVSCSVATTHAPDALQPHQCNSPTQQLLLALVYTTRHYTASALLHAGLTGFAGAYMTSAVTGATAGNRCRHLHWQAL